MPVVGREGDGKHILGVILEPAGGLAGGEVPQPQGLVPGARQSKVSVRGKNHVRYEMAVTMQTLLRDAVVSNIIPGEIIFKLRTPAKFIPTKQKFYLVSFQTMSDLSLDDERIMSGYLGLVVIWVTQPLWPRSVPRSCRVSVILPLLSFSARFKSFTGGKSSENCASKTQSNLAFNIGGGQEHNLILVCVLLSTADPTSPPRSNKTNLDCNVLKLSNTSE